MKYLLFIMALSFSFSAHAYPYMAECYKDSIELKISQTGVERAVAEIYFEGVLMISEEGSYKWPSDTRVLEFTSDKKSGVRYLIKATADLWQNNDDDNSVDLQYVSRHTGRLVKTSLMCK